MSYAKATFMTAGKKAIVMCVSQLHIPNVAALDSLFRLKAGKL